MSILARIGLLFTLALLLSLSEAAELDKRKQLERESFWGNRDFEWYEQNIPFFECPDAEITTTYYYRWDLVTRHICYGSPDTGYTFTEFANRPFWSGRFGRIGPISRSTMYRTRATDSQSCGKKMAIVIPTNPDCICSLTTRKLRPPINFSA